MSAEVDSMPRENLPLTQTTTYATANIETDPLTTTSRAMHQPDLTSISSPAATQSSSPSSSSSSSFALPSFIVTPIELALSALGRVAQSCSGFLGLSGDLATNRAKPWLEFFDLSAFKLVDNGSFSDYLQRIRINAPYFAFNYCLLGLALTVISVITKPLAIVGVGALLWVYFQFFGAETRDGDFQMLGFSFDTTQKVGMMVFLGIIVFWVTAGGLEIFFSLLTATVIVTLAHGAFRKPSHNALPDSSAV